MDTVIITGSSDFTLPPELSDVPAIDFPLPNRQEIKALLDCSLAEKNKERIEKAFLGLERHEIENLIARSLVRKGGLELETIESLREELLQKRANDYDSLEIHFPKENLDQVGGMEFLPDGRILVTEKGGTIQLVTQFIGIRIWAL